MNTASIRSIPVESISRIYSGRSGCMCGCRGKYHETERSIRRVLKNMTDWMDFSRVEASDFSGPSLQGEAIISVDDGAKTYVIYLKPGVQR